MTRRDPVATPPHRITKGVGGVQLAVGLLKMIMLHHEIYLQEKELVLMGMKVMVLDGIRAVITSLDLAARGSTPATGA